MRDAVGAVMGPMEMTYADKDEDFDGWLRATDVGALRIVHGSAPRGTFTRTWRLIGRSDPALFGLWMPREHGWVLEQDGRRATLRAGEFAFVDLSRPFRTSGAMHDFASVVLPRALLPLGAQATRRLTGVGFSGERPDGALVSALVGRLVGHIDAYSGAGAARVGSALLDLITSTLTARLGRSATSGDATGNDVLRLRINAFIEERLGDPDLSPATIAAAHHVSLRQLYKLFAYDGRTVAAWVRRRRLERSRSDLIDPALRDRPVGAVAARWGMTDPASFNRAFRALFGVPPGMYRRLSMRQQRLCTSDQRVDGGGRATLAT
jgi:AraC-like DNA-binding protein